MAKVKWLYFWVTTDGSVHRGESTYVDDLFGRNNTPLKDMEIAVSSEHLFVRRRVNFEEGDWLQIFIHPSLIGE